MLGKCLTVTPENEEQRIRLNSNSIHISTKPRAKEYHHRKGGGENNRASDKALLHILFSIVARRNAVELFERAREMRGVGEAEAVADVGDGRLWI